MTQLVSVLGAKPSDWGNASTGYVGCDVGICPKLGGWFRGRQSYRRATCVVRNVLWRMQIPPALRAERMALGPYLVSIK